MQILAETFDFMRRVLHMSYRDMSDTFAQWNASKLNSFLVEVTAEVLRKQDAETGKPLVEMVLDKAAQKGTGKWTSQVAMDLGVPIPTIDAAVAMRQISAQKETRIKMAERFGSQAPTAKRGETHGEAVTSAPLHDAKAERALEDVKTQASEQQTGARNDKPAQTIDLKLSKSDEIQEEFAADLESWLEKLEDALMSSFVVTYAQGLSLLQVASKEKGLGVDLAEVAKIWRGGCIIRSSLLEDMRAAYASNPDLPNLMLDERFAATLVENCPDLHEVVGRLSQSRVPSLALSSAVAYFEAFRSDRLPANLIQAQRDYFGAHTYQRTDREGVFHTEDW